MSDRVINCIRSITDKMIVVGIAFGALAWILESLVHVLLFQRDIPLIQQIFTPEPHEIWMRSSIMGLFIVLGVYAQSVITVRKRAEEALRESEKKWRAQYKSIPIPTYTWQKVGGGFVLVDYNDAAMTITQGQIADLVGMSAKDWYQDRPEILRDFSRCFAERVSIEREMAYQFKTTGENRYFAAKYAFVPPDLVLVHTEDITARKQAEEALERRAAQLVLLNDIGSQITAVGELTSVLGRAAHLVQASFGYHHVALFTLDRERGELVMRARAGDFEHLFPPDHRLELGQGLVGWVGRHGETLLVNDVDTEPQYINLYPDQVPTRSELSVPIRIGGEIVGVLDVQSPQLDAFDGNDRLVMETLAGQIAVAFQNMQLVQDLQNQMDELKQTQAQLIQSAKLAAIGELAAGVAHELNNPLTAVLGFSELLLRETAPDAPNRQELEDIAEGARRARDIVHNLLSFSRQTEFLRQPADVNQAVQETLALSRRRLEHAKIVVQEYYAPDLPLLRLDVGRMKQVVLNLVTNALHAMPQGGTLTVTTERVGDEVAVRVTDTGVGIPADHLPRIFEPFFTTRPIGQGTGLGLSISLGIVQEHGGYVQVESQEGVGSTFTVWLSV